MNWWCGDASWSVWGWWWVSAADRHGFVYYAVQCFSDRRLAGRRFSCWGGVPDDRLDELRKEIRELKDEIGKMKKT